MRVRCGKCKSSDIEAAYPPTRFEEKLAWVLPLSPYQCDKCERRFLSWANPLMDRNRTIAAGVLVGLLSLGVILIAISEPDMPAPMVARPKQEQPTRPAPTKPLVEPSEKKTESTIEPSPAKPSTTTATAPATDPVKPKPESERGAETVTQPPTPAARHVETPVTAPPPTEGRYSASVLDQLRQNEARDRGMPVVEPGKGVTQPTKDAVLPTKDAAQPTKDAAQPTKDAAQPTKDAAQPTAAAAKQSSATTAKPAAPAVKPDEAPLQTQAKAKSPVTAPLPKAKPATSPTKERARLDDIRIESKGEALDIHIVCSGPLMPEGRLLAKVYFVDLPGRWEVKRGLRDRLLDHPLVAGMRLGRHPEHLRIAFDLKGQPIVANFKIEPSGLLLHFAPKE